MSARQNDYVRENAQTRYAKANLVAVRVAFNRKTEPELVERIEREESKATYLKRLVREDVERERRLREEQGGQ